MNKYQARFIESVLKKVIDGKYTKSMACLKTGYSRPYLYELIKKYKKEGYQSLIHKNTRREPINKTDFNKQNQIIDLYKTCHQLISHPEKIEKRAEKPLKIILL